MELLRNSEIPVSEWDGFLEVNPHSTPFQSHKFFHLINSVGTLSSEALAVTSAGDLKALAVAVVFHDGGINGFFSRRAIIYGGPLVDHSYPEALELLTDTLTQILRNRVIYIETRNLSDYSDLKEVYRGQSWKYLPHYNFNLRTYDHLLMTKAVSESRMRQIKKAIRSGVTWRQAESLNEVECFYRILAGLYRSKVRKPLMPWDFFSGAFEKEFGIYLLVLFNNNIIGGIMCPVLEKKALYEFYVCGLDKEYKDQYPSVMATWAAMEYAGKNNIPVFDFMGAGNSEAEYGVRDFKARFGGDLVEFGRFQKIYRPLLYCLGKTALKMLSFRKA